MQRSVYRGLALLVVFSFLSAGCAAMQGNPKTTLGGALGAAGGGLIASAAGGDSAMIAGAVLLGGLLGGAVGNALDQRDKEIAMRQAQTSLESARSGQTSTWRNPDSGNSGSFTPTSTYQTQSGQYCREYTQTIQVGGESHQSYGTACRMPDGSWKIQ
jgi:surface antigen